MFEKGKYACFSKQKFFKTDYNIWSHFGDGKRSFVPK